jgi:hypothetical protein
MTRKRFNQINVVLIIVYLIAMVWAGENGHIVTTGIFAFFAGERWGILGFHGPWYKR